MTIITHKIYFYAEISEFSKETVNEIRNFETDRRFKLKNIRIFTENIKI